MLCALLIPRYHVAGPVAAPRQCVVKRGHSPYHHDWRYGLSFGGDWRQSPPRHQATTWATVVSCVTSL